MRQELLLSYDVEQIGVHLTSSEKMNLIKRAFPYTIFLLCLVLATPLLAEPLVRSSSQLEQVPVQGITLSMTPKKAFETLRSAGFMAGNLHSYEDWESDGIEFVRGQYGSSSGHSSVTFSRRGVRIYYISETFNSPGNPIDAETAIGKLREQLDIPAESEKCKTVNAHSGLCEVEDAKDPNDITILFKLQILSTMRIVTITRPKEIVQH